MKHNKVAYTSTFRSYKPIGPLRPGANDYRNIESKKDTINDTGKKLMLYYTGDELIGIATMHKSNAVPVTKNSDMAKAISKMRRG